MSAHRIKKITFASLAVWVGLLAIPISIQPYCEQALAKEKADLSSAAIPKTDAGVADSTVAALVRWIGDHTDYDVTGTLRNPPQTKFCSTGEIINYEGKKVVVDKELVAAYDRINRVIYLVRPWSPSNLLDISRVLHELIHDVQFTNRRCQCKGKPEWETYHLQSKWLAEHGVEKRFDWNKIFFMSQCPEDVLPMIRPTYRQ